jgi:hypothetical protein
MNSRVRLQTPGVQKLKKSPNNYVVETLWGRIRICLYGCAGTENS